MALIERAYLSLEIGAEKLDEQVDGFGGPRGLLGDAPVAPEFDSGDSKWQTTPKGED